MSSNGQLENRATTVVELVHLLMGLVVEGADPDCVMVVAPDGEQFYAGLCFSDEGTLTIVGTH